ncbi:hypothetical protein BKA61DRAFT_571715 [Leptodontidium sp. MPI-SDFR-AT-0119]|nr:hypothetical protein BKA61DRAFT_571715 [Leptodontidium sp. MPI-SDFR-AT-0119]
MGDILQKEGWDCPESVELNIWVRVFRCNEDKFDAEKLLELGKPFSELLDLIARLRHTAVHRVRHVIDDLRNKDLLESILKEKAQEINAQRRELDNLECKAAEDMLREDKEYQTLASTNLEQAIGAPTTIQQSASTSEHDTSSEVEVEVESVRRPSFVHVGESGSSSKPTDMAC